MSLYDIIRQEVESYVLSEDVRTFNVYNSDKHQLERPLKEKDKLRVYHGFGQIKDALLAAIYGISGGEKAKRTYFPYWNDGVREIFRWQDPFI